MAEPTIRQICRVSCPECGSTQVGLEGVTTNDEGDGDLTRIEARCRCFPAEHAFRVEIDWLGTNPVGTKVVVQTATGWEDAGP
jgi:hypothetical protein